MFLDNDVVVHAQHLVGNGFSDLHVGVAHLAGAEERGELRRIGLRDRKLRRDPVAGAEPVPVGESAVFVLQHEVAYPVDIGPAGHAGRSGYEREACRIDVHLTVEHRRCQPFGMEADLVDLATLEVHAVYEKIVVEGFSALGQGAGEADVEQVDEVVVEIYVTVHSSGELRYGEVVFDARDAAGTDHLAFEGGFAAAVEVGGRFGDHGREIGLPGQCRGVDVVEDESEVALQTAIAELRTDVRQVEFHLRVCPAAVGVVAVGVVA